MYIIKRSPVVLLSILVLISMGMFAQELETPIEDSPNRGKYFVKKKYEASLPVSFSEAKAKLPQPVLEHDSIYLEMYWKAWEMAWTHIKQPPVGSPLVSNFIDEAFNESIYQWDTHFMLMFWKYAHQIFPAIESHDNFYARQHDNGLICRIIDEKDGSDHVWSTGKYYQRAINPPLFSWVELQHYKFTGDKKRFALILPVLEKYIEWIEKNRRGTDTPHQLYWSNGQQAMDNTPRDEGRPEGHHSMSHVGWVDISSQMVITYNDLSTICQELGLPEKAEFYHSKAISIAEKINRWMWNEKDGLYYDVDEKGKQTPWKTGACFWPMLAGIANKSQQEKMIANLKDQKSFWRPIIFPSLSADQKHYNPSGAYWLGGVWAPLNYMIIKGLNKNDYNAFATEASEKYLSGIGKVYAETNTFWECYAPESFVPGTAEDGKTLTKKDFIGWTGLGPISLLIENIIGINIDVPANTVIWNLSRTDKHGISNLPFGSNNVDLLCSKVGERYTVTVNSSSEIILKIRQQKKKELQFSIHRGYNNFQF